MKRGILWGLLGLSLAALTAISEAGPLPPTPPLTAQLAAAGTPKTVNATTSSGSSPVALGASPANYPVEVVVNNGGAEAFCTPGGATVTVTTSNYQFAIPSGGSKWFWDNTSTYLACVTAATTATVRVSQATGAPGTGVAVADATGTGGVISGNVGVLNSSSAQIDPSTSQAQATNTAAIQETHATLGSAATKVEATQTDNVADGPTVTASVTSATTILTVNTTGYGYGLLQFTSIGTSNTFIVEGSNDGTPGTGTTFEPVGVYALAGTASVTTAVASTPATTTVYAVPYTGNTIRVRVVAYTSGTVTAFVTSKRGTVPGTQSGVVGNVASAGTDGGNPVKIGGKYNTTSLALTNGQRGDMQIGANGALIVQQGAVEALRWFANVPLSATGNNVIHASCGAGLKNYLTHLDWSANTTSVANTIEALDGASTVVWSEYVPAGSAHSDHEWPIASILGSAATAMNVAITGSPTGALIANAAGYCAP